MKFITKQQPVTDNDEIELDVDSSLCYLEFTRGVLKFSHRVKTDSSGKETILYRAVFITDKEISVETDTSMKANYSLNKLASYIGWSKTFPPVVIDEKRFNEYKDRILDFI